MDIYVKRSQRLYSSSPMRKALLVFTVTGAEISALADPSMNGKGNIVRHMREIDTARYVLTYKAPCLPYKSPCSCFTT